MVCCNGMLKKKKKRNLFVSHRIMVHADGDSWILFLLSGTGATIIAFLSRF